MDYTPPEYPKCRLSEEATRTRRNLIVAFAMWLIVVPLELHPTEIAVFGIKLSEAAISIPTLITLALLYFCASFSVYAYPDWEHWRHDCASRWRELTRKIEAKSQRVIELEAALDSLDENRRNDEGHFLEVRFSGDSGASQKERIVQWERYLETWRTEKNILTRQHSTLSLDIILRTFWDYVFPLSIWLAPWGYAINKVRESLWQS